jgi:hypothetical protein
LPNSLEDVAITKGSAYVEGNGNRTRVRAGEHIMLEEGHSEVLTLNPADEWELWNVDRDRVQSRSAKADSYLPDELRSYSAEMDTNGSWVYVPEYGRVWRPTVMVADDWAPYRSGRWVWKGDDYVWLSFESWGWVPYHFGRWAVVSGFGWCWVPPARGDVYWGPGYVGWYRTGSQVGWTPLAPGEVFYGHRNYGRQSVNITNVTVNTSTVVYRNRASRGGLTVVAHDDFLRGRTVVQQPARNSNVSVAVSVGSPRIKPLRETRMPIVKQTPPRVAPPRIEQHDSRDLRSRFPRVTPETTGERRRQQPAPAAAVPPTTSRPAPQTREKKTVFPVIAPPERTPGTDRQPYQVPPPQREERRQPSTQTPAVSQPPRTAPPASPPQQTDRQQREERRQQPTQTPAVSQPPRTAPPASPPQQPDRQQHEERRQGERPLHIPTQAVPAAPQGQPPASAGAPQRTEQPRRTPAPADTQNRPTAVPSRVDGRQPGTTTIAPATSPSKPAAAPRTEQPRQDSATKEKQQKKVWKVTTPESANEKDPGGKDNRGKEHRER